MSAKLVFGHGYSRYAFSNTVVNKYIPFVAKRFSAQVAQTSSSQNDPESCKPFSALPGPDYKIPIVSQLRDILRYRGKGHISQQDAVKHFGPIYKVNIFGVLEFVFIADVEAVEKLHRLDSKTPRRMVLELWKEWRDDNGHKLGLLLSESDNWKRLRKPVDKQMMRPQVVQNYVGDFNEVVTDFVKFIRETRTESGLIEQLDKELFRWSLEGMAKVLYGKRLGNFTNKGSDPEVEEFIKSVHSLFITTEELSNYPKFLRKTLFRRNQMKHEKAWDVMFSLGKKMIDETMTEMQASLERGEEVQGFLPLLLAGGELEMSDVYANISELMLAAVDTTSNTIQWCMYHLTENPEKLHKLEEEVLRAAPPGVTPTQEHIAHMPYLKAVIKDVLRLVPIAGVVTRTTEIDMVLSGYHIPAGTNVLACVYQMGRNPDLYTDPDEFQPERWLRGEDGKKIHSFAWLPFGHGARGCVGRRVAELEMHLLMARLVQQFHLESGDNKDVHIVSRGLLQPNKPVEILFRDRDLR